MCSLEKTFELLLIGVAPHIWTNPGSEDDHLAVLLPTLNPAEERFVENDTTLDVDSLRNSHSDAAFYTGADAVELQCVDLKRLVDTVFTVRHSADPLHVFLFPQVDHWEYDIGVILSALQPLTQRTIDEVDDPLIIVRIGETDPIAVLCFDADDRLLGFLCLEEIDARSLLYRWVTFSFVGNFGAVTFLKPVKFELHNASNPEIGLWVEHDVAKTSLRKVTIDLGDCSRLGLDFWQGRQTLAVPAQILEEKGMEIRTWHGRPCGSSAQILFCTPQRCRNSVRALGLGVTWDPDDPGMCYLHACHRTKYHQPLVHVTHLNFFTVFWIGVSAVRRVGLPTNLLEVLTSHKIDVRKKFY